MNARHTATYSRRRTVQALMGILFFRERDLSEGPTGPCYLTSTIFEFAVTDCVPLNICSPVPDMFVSLVLEVSTETRIPSLDAKYTVPLLFEVPSMTSSI